ncbi:MAG TPA: transketolase [Solirubrobacteraceae bacterium]|nr:transketolase [Solirubrobacteraceae bacterium]
MSAAPPATEIDELCINTIRTLAMDAVQKANSGHPGTPMALAPLAYTLYTRVMRHNPANANWPNRDRFVLSCGHASMLLYASLYLCGYGLELEDLENFRQIGSPCAGHPEYGHAAGIEATTGPLGQGISTSVGLALAERMLAARFNRDGHEIIDHHTFTIVSDGDLEEGISGEASSLAGHLGLGRLIAFYDDNHISIEGDTALAFSEDVGARYEAYGWHVRHVGEDISVAALEAAARAAIAVADRPSLIICRTHIAFGAPHKQDTAGAHGSPLGEEEVRLTKEGYGWPLEPAFHVPAEALAHFRATIGVGEAAEAEWNERFAGYRAAFPELAGELEAIFERRVPPLPAGFLRRFEAGTKIATRKASQEVLQVAAEIVPHALIGGSADLAPSTLTLMGEGGVERGSYGGRNLHFGIREHAMGAIVNGLVLSGFRAFGATFLVFSDYMKGAIRLAALMRIPSIFCYTHDSIGVGEDGPTHQPIEQLAALRATPNINVVRPADAHETALAWSFALSATETPTVLALSRQSLVVLEAELVPLDAIERGAYVLRECNGEPELVLIASGSEVGLCVAAADELAAAGTAVRVVSMPCMDRFESQPRAERERVLGPAGTARIAVEAASPFGWDRWVGERGAIIAMRSFGASGPEAAVYEHFGITTGAIVEQARALLGPAVGH